MVFCIVICEVFVMNGYITVQEAALKWGISPRQVQILWNIFHGTRLGEKQNYWKACPPNQLP